MRCCRTAVLPGVHERLEHEAQVLTTLHEWTLLTGLETSEEDAGVWL